MQSFKAILAGALTDAIGTVLFSMVYMIVVGVYLTLTGELSSPVNEEELVSVFLDHPWDYIANFFGCLISVLAGYITAKVSKTNVYFCTCFVGASSVMLAFYSGYETYPFLINLLSSALTLASVFLGAYAWLKRNPPNQSPDLEA